MLNFSYVFILDTFQFHPMDRNGTLFLEIRKLLHIGEKNTHTIAQEPLDFRMTKPKQNFNFDDSLIVS